MVFQSIFVLSLLWSSLDLWYDILRSSFLFIGDSAPHQRGDGDGDGDVRIPVRDRTEGLFSRIFTSHGRCLSGL